MRAPGRGGGARRFSTWAHRRGVCRTAAACREREHGGPASVVSMSSGRTSPSRRRRPARSAFRTPRMRVHRRDREFTRTAPVCAHASARGRAALGPVVALGRAWKSRWSRVRLVEQRGVEAARAPRSGRARARHSSPRASAGNTISGAAPGGRGARRRGAARRSSRPAPRIAKYDHEPVSEAGGSQIDRGRRDGGRRPTRDELGGPRRALVAAAVAVLHTPRRCAPGENLLARRHGLGARPSRPRGGAACGVTAPRASRAFDGPALPSWSTTPTHRTRWPER